MAEWNRSHDLRNDIIAGNTDTSLLKLLALLFMFIDHFGVILPGSLPEMRIIGRMAFPLYAWCLVVGSVKTRNPFRYGLRLFCMALISQPLYMMALNHSWSELGILFSLFVAMIAIQGIRIHRFGSQVWVPVLCYVLLGFIKVDYGWKGLTFILVLYLARESRSGLIAAYLAYALFWGTSSSAVTNLFGVQLSLLHWPGIGSVLYHFFRLQGMIWLSLPLIVCSTNSGLRMSKWLGYGLYPMHLIVLILYRLLSGTTFSTLIRGF